MKKIQFNISGMTCTACASAIERKVGQINGVESAVINFSNEKLVVQHDPDLAPASLIISTIVALGYGAELFDQDIASSINKKETGKPGTKDG